MLQTAGAVTTERRGRHRKYPEGVQLSRPSVRLTPEQDERLSALAVAEGLNVQDLFVKLIDDAVAAHPERDMIERRVIRRLAERTAKLDETAPAKPRKPRRQ